MHSDIVKLTRAALGGRPVLLPVPQGEKVPYGTKWLEVEYEDTLAPDYEEDLSGGNNIGVLLGPASVCKSLGEVYHLVAINIDDFEAALDFDTLNVEVLTGCLWTDTDRGRIYWVWVQCDTLPESGDIFAVDEMGERVGDRWGSLLAHGTHANIYGVHPSGNEYASNFEGGKAVKLEFEKLKWPEGYSLPWVPDENSIEAIIEDYGPPFGYSKNGALMVNEPYWPAAYAAKQRVLYQPEESRFYQYLPVRGLWAEQTDSSIKHAFGREIMLVGKERNEPGLVWKRKNSLFNALVDLLKGQVERYEEFKRVPGRIHLKNGMLNIRSNPPTLSPFAPGHYSRNQIPYSMDPDADCPRFKKELLEAAVPDYDIDVMQRWAGMVLLGINMGQKILMLTGTAGAGKSTLMNVLTGVIGNENIAAVRTKLLDQRFELYNYVGKTLLIGSDVPGDFLMQEGAYVLKSLVGGDPLTAEKKNGESMTIIGEYNVGITSNSRLRVSLDGDTGAWERRLILIPYVLPKPKKADPRFKEKLLESEGPGILNWMIEGAIRVLEDYDETGSFKLNSVQKGRIDDLLAESDSIRHFIKTGIGPAEGENVTKEELQTAYVDFCDNRGWKSVGGNRAKQRLNDGMLEVHRVQDRNDIERDGKDKRGWKGVRVIPYEK